jgi:hypothetical protein
MRDRTEPIIAERHDKDEPLSLSQALMAARKKLGPDAHVRRIGDIHEVGVFKSSGGFQVKGTGLTFNAALKRAK